MEYETLTGPNGDPVVEGGFVCPVGPSWSEHDVQFLSESSRTQAQDHPPHPTHTNRPMQSHDREAHIRILRTTTAADDRHDPANERCTPVATALCAQTPSNHTRTCNKLPGVYM